MITSNTHVAAETTTQAVGVAGNGLVVNELHQAIWMFAAAVAFAVWAFAGMTLWGWQ